MTQNAPKRFRKRPVQVWAMELTWDSFPAASTWSGGQPFYDPSGKAVGLSITTLEGRFDAPFGWWIVQGVEGEFYAVKPSVFGATYEPSSPLTSSSSGLQDGSAPK